MRKVERQYTETLVASGLEYEELKVNESTIEAYLRNFSWDFARYQHQGKKLSELVAQILSMSAQVDDDLKKLSTAHAEKTALLSSLERKKNINLSTSDFEDFLTPDMLSRFEILDNEHLQTVFVAMPKSSEAEFLKEYVNLGLSTDAEFNGEKLPLVAPDSAKLVLSQGEQVMYLMTVLKGKYEPGHYEEGASAESKDSVFVPGKLVDYTEPLKSKFRERRFVLRTFSFDEAKAGGLDALADKAKRDVVDSQLNIIRWSKATFGTAFPALIHLKVVYAFVESVLRYGMPVDFLAVFVDPNLKREKELKKVLVDTICKLRPELKESRGKLEKDEEGAFSPLVQLVVSLIYLGLFISLTFFSSSLHTLTINNRGRRPRELALCPATVRRCRRSQCQ